MVGTRLTELPPINEAVATYMMRASEKLRAQNSHCKKVRVSIRTGMFNPDEAKYANGVVVGMPYPTDDVRLLTKAAVDAAQPLPAGRGHRRSVRRAAACGGYQGDVGA